MAGDVKGDNEPYDDINITPMVDLTFVLLLIFIRNKMNLYSYYILG